MTNNNIYFVANWKMYGNLTSLNALNKVINIFEGRFSNTVLNEFQDQLLKKI